jgi:hypothetical protein
MKYIAKVKFPNEPGNELVKDPQFGMKMKQLLDDVKAEAAYFGTIDGCRGCYVVVTLNDPSQMVQIGEPFFLWLNAAIEFFPVMTPEDLNNASSYFATAIQKWGNK